MKKNIELIFSLINEEMNRFWTRFNIFGAVQVGAVIGIASAAQFFFNNLALLRSVFVLLIAFPISGSIAILRGYDLQRVWVPTLDELEKSNPEGERVLAKAKRNQRLPMYLSSITCSIFGMLCTLFWILGWVMLELTNFNINLSR
jgi:hypothetical protein